MDSKFKKIKKAYVKKQFDTVQRLLEAKGDTLITRDAFLYLNPKGDKDAFATCGTCRDFTGRACMILGKDFPVKAEHSCALYVHDKPALDQAGKEKKLVDPKVAGFTKRAVRCENCIYGDDDNGVCLLFKDLNSKMPDVFDLDEKIDSKGCCNAFVSIEDDDDDEQ